MPFDLVTKVVRSQRHTVTTLEVQMPAVGGQRRRILGVHGERGGRGAGIWRRRKEEIVGEQQDSS